MSDRENTSSSPPIRYRVDRVVASVEHLLVNVLREEGQVAIVIQKDGAETFFELSPDEASEFSRAVQDVSHRARAFAANNLADRLHSEATK